jgi:rRNA maturation endonuclease Nob1
MTAIDWNRIAQFAGAYEDWSPLTREEYEEMMAAANLSPEAFATHVQTDAELATSYGVRTGDWTMSHYTDDTRIAMKLARRRQIALDDEARARRATCPQVEPEIIHCPNCGMQTTRAMLMNASLGTACPECYDELAD